MTIIQTTKALADRYTNDLYPTPVEFCRAALDTLHLQKDFRNILDPGAGLGAWGKAVNELTKIDERFSNSKLIGVELDEDTYPDDNYYDEWVTKDFLEIETHRKFDLIIGNPPYRQAEEFVRKSFELLAKGGIVLFLLRLSFLEGQARGKNLWKQYPPWIVHVISKRISFTGNRKSDETAYALYRWEEPYLHFSHPSALTWLDWDYEGDVVYADLGSLRVYRVVDNYFIDPKKGDIYYVEDHKFEGT